MSLMFSVVIPAYNCSNVIEDAIKSVCNQTMINAIGEIIVVNDGSTDDTLKRIECIKENCDIPIVVVDQPNGGVSRARNEGASRANYDWIAFLDSDDEWLNDKIERQVNIIHCLGEENVDALGGSFSGDTLRLLFKKYHGVFKANIKQICIRNFPQPSTSLIKKVVFEEIGGFDEKQNYAEDGKFFLEVCDKYNLYYDTKQVIVFGHGKRGFGNSGLSGNLKEMHRGNLKNITGIYKEARIGFCFLCFLRVFYWAKYIRRIVISKLGN